MPRNRRDADAPDRSRGRRNARTAKGRSGAPTMGIGGWNSSRETLMVSMTHGPWILNRPGIESPPLKRMSLGHLGFQSLSRSGSNARPAAMRRRSSLCDLRTSLMAKHSLGHQDSRHKHQDRHQCDSPIRARIAGVGLEYNEHDDYEEQCEVGDRHRTEHRVHGLPRVPAGRWPVGSPGHVSALPILRDPSDQGSSYQAHLPRRAWLASRRRYRSSGGV